MSHEQIDTGTAEITWTDDSFWLGEDENGQPVVTRTSVGIYFYGASVAIAPGDPGKVLNIPLSAIIAALGSGLSENSVHRVENARLLEHAKKVEAALANVTLKPR